MKWYICFLQIHCKLNIKWNYQRTPGIIVNKYHINHMTIDNISLLQIVTFYHGIDLYDAEIADGSCRIYMTAHSILKILLLIFHFHFKIVLNHLKFFFHLSRTPLNCDDKHQLTSGAIDSLQLTTGGPRLFSSQQKALHSLQWTTGGSQLSSVDNRGLSTLFSWQPGALVCLQLTTGDLRLSSVDNQGLSTLLSWQPGALDFPHEPPYCSMTKIIMTIVWRYWLVTWLLTCDVT
jgi:hypothetical protein